MYVCDMSGRYSSGWRFFASGCVSWGHSCLAHQFCKSHMFLEAHHLNLSAGAPVTRKHILMNGHT